MVSATRVKSPFSHRALLGFTGAPAVPGFCD
jgi:hypothetical protein